MLAFHPLHVLHAIALLHVYCARTQPAILRIYHVDLGKPLEAEESSSYNPLVCVCERRLIPIALHIPCSTRLLYEPDSFLRKSSSRITDLSIASIRRQKT